MEFKRYLLAIVLVLTMLVPASAIINVTNEFVAYYSFEEPDGGPYVDGTGNGHTGTCIGSACPTLGTGKRGGGASFDTNETNVTLENVVQDILADDDSFTVAIWLRPSQCNSNLNGDGQTDAWMVWHNTSGPFGPQTKAFFHNVASSTTCRIGGFLNNETFDGFVGSRGFPSTASESDVAENVFKMFVHTYNATDSRLRSYIDGNASTLNPSLPLGLLEQEWVPDAYLGGNVITGTFTSANLQEALPGIYDELGFWSRPLNDEEIAGLFNNGEGVTINQILNNLQPIVSNDTQGVIGVPDNMTISFVHNKTSGEIVYTFFDDLQSIDSAFFDTFIVNSTGEFFLNRNSTNVTNGTLSFNITPFLSSVNSIKANAFITDDDRVFESGGNLAWVASLFIDDPNDITKQFNKNDAGIFTFIIVLTMVMLGILSRSATAVITLGVAGLLFSSFLFIQLSQTFIMIAAILGLILMWVISKRRVG